VQKEGSSQVLPVLLIARQQDFKQAHVQLGVALAHADLPLNMHLHIDLFAKRQLDTHPRESRLCHSYLYHHLGDQLPNIHGEILATE